MSYLLVRKRQESDLSDAEIWPHRVSDVFLLRESYNPEERGCLIWYVDPQLVVPGQSLRLPEAVHWIQKPLAANYEEIGSGDIRGRSMIQDPLRNIGPYVLDMAVQPATFRRGYVSRSSQELGVEPKIEETLAAGDKVPYNRFYFIGDPQKLFQELRSEGFTFVD